MSDINVTTTKQTVNVERAAPSIRTVSKTQRIVVNRGGESLNRVGTTQQIVVNRGSSTIEVLSTPQKIVVNSPGSSIGVINAGPPGPRGPMGPADLSVYLTEDGQLLTRVLGDLAPITRVDLADDQAFVDAYAAAISAHAALGDPHPGYLLEADFASHIAAADPHPGYLTATEGNAAYVNVGGDTMTGPLTGTSIVMAGSVTAQAAVLSFSGEALKFSTVNGYAAWFSGATRTGYLQGHSSGMILHSEIGTLQLLGTASFNVAPTMPGVNVSTTNVVYWPAYGGGWQMTDTIWMRTYANKSIYAGTGKIGCEGGLSLAMGGAITSGYIADMNGSVLVRGNSITISQVQAQRNQVADPGWGNATFLGNPGAGGSGIAFHAGGTAPQIRTAQNDNYMYFRDAGGSSYTPIAASAFTVNSTRRSKQDVELWPPLSRDLGAASSQNQSTQLLRSLKPVSFRRKEEDFMAEVPEDEKAQKDTANYAIHRCETANCTGEKDSPCSWRANWERGEVGLIVEEVIEYFPEAVMTNHDGEPEGISLAPLVTAVIAAVQELAGRVDQLEGAS